MAEKLSSAYVEIHPWLSSSFSKELSQAMESSGGLEKAGTSAGETFSKAVSKSVSSRLSDFSKSTGKAGDALTKGITLPAAGAATAVGAIFAAKGWDRLSSIDTAKSKLKGLGYTGQEIQSIMDSALASVKGTAYGLGPAANVAVGALAAGVKQGEDLTRVLKTVGDTATIAGGDFEGVAAIFNKVMAKGKLQGDEITQLSERGVPVLQTLAKHLGVTAEEAQKMAADGQVSFETFEAAMRGAFGGAALASGESMVGTIENVWAAVGRVGAAFLDSGGDGEGFFTRLKPLLGEFTQDIDGMTATAAEWGSTFADVFMEGVEVVRGLASAFNDLSPSAKKNAVQLGLVTVAAGPALKGVSKLSAGASVLFKGFEKVHSGLLKAESGLGKATNAFSKTAKQSDKLTSSFKSMGPVASSFNGLLVSGIVAGLGLCAAAFIENQRHISDYANATSGLKAAVRGASDEIVASSTTASAAHARSASEMMAASDRLIQKQSALADSIVETNTKAYAEGAKLDAYKATIEELTGKTEGYGRSAVLTAGEQARLKDAIDKVNEACGTQYTVVDAANGVIADESGVVDNVTDAISRYIEQKKIQIQLDAMEGKYTELITAKEEAYQACSDALKTQAEAQKKYNDALEYSLQGGDQFGTMLEDARRELEAADIAVTDTKDALQSATDASNEFESRMGFLTESAAEGASAWETYLASSGEIGALFASNSSAAGSYSDVMKNLASDLQAAGVSQSDFANLGVAEMTELSSAYDGSIGSIIGKMSEMGLSVRENLVGISNDQDLMAQSVQEAFERCGVSQDDFIARLADTGVSVQDFSALSQEQLAALVEAYANNNGNIIELLSEFVELNRTSSTDAATALNEGFSTAIPLLEATSQQASAAAASGLSGLPGEFANIGNQAQANLSGGLAQTALTSVASSSQFSAALSGIAGLASAFATEGASAASQYADGIGTVGPTTASASNQKTMAVKGVEGTARELQKEGENASKAYSDGIKSKGNQANSAGKEIGRNAEQGAGTADGGKLGGNFGDGYVNGIKAKGSAAYSAGYYLGQQAAAGTKAAQQSNSPAKVSRYLGNDYGDGYGLGMVDKYGFIAKSAEGMVESANSSLSDAMAWQARIPLRASYAESTDAAYDVSNLVEAIGILHEDLVAIYDIIPEGMTDRDFQRRARRAVNV